MYGPCEHSSRAASNATAGAPFTVQHADWIALTKALDSSPDTPPATLALKAQRLAKSRTAALKQSGRGDRGAVTYQLGYDGRNLEQGELYRNGELIGITFDSSDAEQIAMKLSGWKAMRDALRDAEKFMRVVRNYFPKSIRNTDKFNLENTNAAIGKALHLADPQPDASDGYDASEPGHPDNPRSEY